MNNLIFKMMAGILVVLDAIMAISLIAGFDSRFSKFLPFKAVSPEAELP